MHKDLHDLLKMQNEPCASIEKLEVTRAPGQQELQAVRGESLRPFWWSFQGALLVPPLLKSRDEMVGSPADPPARTPFAAARMTSLHGQPQ